MEEFNPAERFNPHTMGDVLEIAQRKSKRDHKWYRGLFSEMYDLIPGSFARRPFKFNGEENKYYDVIFNDEGTPISIVSKSYSLIDHRKVVDSVKKSLLKNNIELEKCIAEMYLGDLGAKFGFRVLINDRIWDPGDGKHITARIEGVNSVDRTTPFRLAVGFYRRVCGNGNAWGTGRINIIRVHRSGQINQEEVEQVIERGINSLDEIVKDFKKMNRTPIPTHFPPIVAKLIRKKWGKKLSHSFEQVWDDGIYNGIRVPGINVPCKNLWDIYNSMSWVASGQRAFSRQTSMLRDCNEILIRAFEEAQIHLD